MNSTSILTGLWDYGWLRHDTVPLSPAAADWEMIQQYVGSPAFHTSFLPNDQDEQGIHGPFQAGLLSAEDYLPLHEAELERYLESLEVSEKAGEDLDERDKILHHFRHPFAGGCKCYVLRRDEHDKDLFHDWGFVLFVFREFLFVGPQRDRLERFVVGYD